VNWLRKANAETITIEEAREFQLKLGRSEKGAARLLRKAVAAHVLKRTGTGRGTKYKVVVAGSK
jgi:predicted HTH transcriptional regulator